MVSMTHISRSSDFCLISWRLFDVWTSYFGIMRQYHLMCDLKINVGHCDLYFMLQWFFFISWRLFDVWTSYFEIESVWLDIWPKNKCRSLWPIFHGPVILPYILMTIWCMNIILRNYESVQHDIWPQNKCRSLWSIFHGPMILPYILKTIWYMNTLLWDYESVWPQNICDVYFMVQWFCLISWKLFSGWTSYFGIMSQYDPTWPPNICGSLWPIFHGPLNLPFILKTSSLFDLWTLYFWIISRSQYDMTFDLKINVGHCDLYFMVQWFCLIS